MLAAHMHTVFKVDSVLHSPFFCCFGASLRLTDFAKTPTYCRRKKTFVTVDKDGVEEGMTRHERIAALEEQLANSRKRRTHLLGSLGKEEGDGNGGSRDPVMRQATSNESVGRPLFCVHSSLALS